MRLEKLLNAKKNEIKIMKLRGFDTSSQDKFSNMEVSDFYDYYKQIKQVRKEQNERSILFAIYPKLSDPSYKIMAYYGTVSKQSNTPKVNIDVAKNISGLINNGYAFDNNGKQEVIKISEAIVILSHPFNSPSKTIIEESINKPIIVFLEDELMFNPNEHADVPRHELLSPTETANKLKELNIDKSKLIIIKSTDPIVKFHGWKVGDVIRIHRNDKSVNLLSSNSINYRLIV